MRTINKTTQTVKRLFLLCAISVVAMCSATASANPEPPKRHGWDLFELYGDVESVVVTQYELEDRFGEVVRSKIKRYKKPMLLSEFGLSCAPQSFVYIK